MTSMNFKKERDGGFTLLELLIVISIIAILSVALVLVLNPAEALRKSRDAQRISDLSTMKTALGLYLTSTSTPYLGLTNNLPCFLTPGLTAPVTPTKIYYSSPTSITHTGLMGASAYAAAAVSVGAANLSLTDGTGWIPVNFDSLIGGSPISNIPVDPINTLNGNGGTTDGYATGISPASYFYRYACSATPLTFEMNAILESSAYTTGADDKRASDGGNNASFYEVGTNLKILDAGTDF
ncbi:MAG: hypothetical protein A2747_03955 [Candidatus Yonathbacteria bacterium RIFCSPHIGHO2_01_FULL_44_41]|uniref:Type II secretion system protein GspG C-terminal domain-containing protein n=1 Tax=Candidatus Yonathbacteria bacterium RIFCSPHIGHO2_02_FULL_44_14 TaxID=1802724 RepID=A0A1G2S7I1_9BACT|nr:MAG: hypothetical protein A2747_03955 [Candidatus Yonathbacteria bacterium RIFCSPHIGHO2_01_FULL_44_41]OHA81074.1 MAG: hypothetical protein A3D51_01845 [Candidatus Yonathbacteria bacterium RIFCSPHIGHO2_02_FULL_44_14]OHA81297.1 MAG: hypothetical protein A3B06_03555 [Candidatus Yonathbacteria bacterium RIFCSPLOWO2_01_FULL_43_20]